MRVRKGPSIAFLAVLLVLGCSEKKSESDAEHKGEPAQRRDARIVFHVPGDDIGSEESRKKLEEIKNALVANRIGDVVSSGYGMGTMEVVVAINGDMSNAEVRRRIDIAYPDAKYRIEQTTR